MVPGYVLCNMSNSFFPGRGLQPLPPTRRCLTLVALFLHHVWHTRVRAPLSATLAALCGKIHVSKIFHLDGTVLFVLSTISVAPLMHVVNLLGTLFSYCSNDICSYCPPSLCQPYVSFDVSIPIHESCYIITTFVNSEAEP